MTPGTKRIVLLFLSMTLISIILLSSSLSNLQLHVGKPFPGAGDSDDSIPPFTALPAVNTYFNTFLKGMFALIFLILAIYVPARLIALADIKQIFWLALIILLLLALVIAIPRIMPGKLALLPEESSNIAISPSLTYPTSPLGNPPQEFVWFVLFVFMLGAFFLAGKMLKRQLWPAHADELLLQEAENAISALNAGEDFKNVIIRCYLQMSRVLREEHGIERSYTMTVREFEDWLEFKGMPRIPVHQLTRLFEKVRYGKQQMSKDDEKIGVESLNEIIQFCRRERD